MTTTVKISRDVYNRLVRLASYRDTMNSVISRLLDLAESNEARRKENDN
jgi:predicted CopG family antitoxin